MDLAATATLLFGLTQGLANLWALGNGSFTLSERLASLWQIYREAIIRH